MPLKILRALLLGCAVAAGSAAAQDALPVAPPAAPAAVAAPTPAVPAPIAPAPIAPARAAPVVKVDESALRYYARNNELDRVEAEIRRLQTLHPGWTAPDDLYSQKAAGPDEQPFWDLFGADRLDELDALIAEKQASQPGWTPSAELAAKIAYKRVRQRLVNASDIKQWGKVVELAASEGFLLACEDIDVMWRVAEAHAEQDAAEPALGIYRRILTECTDPPGRLATVQKALAVLPPSQVEPLLALGRPNADGTHEFDPIRPDLFRARLGAIAGGAKTENVDPLELAAFEKRTEADTANIDDAGLLGWFYYGQEKWEPAQAWFQKALARGGDVKVAEGSVLALRGLEKLDEAEALAAEWADRSESVQALFLGLGAARLTIDPPPKLEASYVERYAVATEAAKSADGSQALGWFTYNTGKPEAAKGWFEKSMEWEPRDTTALGLVLSHQRLGAKKKVKELIAAYSAEYPSVATFGETLAAAERGAKGKGGKGGGGSAAAAALRDGKYEKCLASLGRQSRLTAADSLIQGWCLMGASRPREASAAFDAALSGDRKTRDDAAYGKSLALLRSGLASEAAQVATRGDLTSKRRNEIGTSVLAQQAADLFRAGRYRDTLNVLDKRSAFGSEPRDLGILRGWSLYHLRRLRDARQVFAMLDGQLSTKESRSGLGAVQNEMLPARHR